MDTENGKLASRHLELGPSVPASLCQLWCLPGGASQSHILLPRRCCSAHSTSIRAFCSCNDMYKKLFLFPEVHQRLGMKETHELILSGKVTLKHT